MEDFKSRRRNLDSLRAQMLGERSSFLTHWRDLGDYILPRRPRFTVSDVNRGDRRNQKIIDSTATLASRTQRSGMMSGITSPARPWFRLTTLDPDMTDYSPVKQWLHVVTQRMSTVFLRSNLYNVLPICYGDIGTFATSAIGVEEDFDTVIRCYPFPVGSYCIANNYKMQVNVFQRDFRVTARQLVEKWGKLNPKTGAADWTNISSNVRNMWDKGNYEEWVDICHFIQPNSEFDSRRGESKFKKFSSVYYESGSSGKNSSTYTDMVDTFLSDSGYDNFPVLAPRWEVNGEDVYGTSCPGMEALGDIRALQVMQKRKAQAVEKIVNPPMVAPTGMRTVKASILPGDITYADEQDGRKGFRPAHEVNFRVNELAEDIRETQQRISRAFYEDLFLMLSQSDRRQITAREIEERHEEKLLALGPVLEQLNQDLLNPLIDITFDVMTRQGLIPPAPEELQGSPLKVEYISIMAQAQKLVGISGVERFAGFVTQVAAVDPEAMDKVNRDNLIDTYADMTSIPPGIVRTDDEANEIRSGRNKAMAAQQAAVSAKDASTAAKNLSQTDMTGDNALVRLAQGVGGGEAV